MVGSASSARNFNPNSNRIKWVDSEGVESRFYVQEKFALQKKLKVLIVEDNGFSMQGF
jgi:hypothetical protein